MITIFLSSFNQIGVFVDAFGDQNVLGVSRYPLGRRLLQLVYHWHEFWCKWETTRLMALGIYWEHRHPVSQLLKIRRHRAVTHSMVLPTIEATICLFVKAVNCSMISSIANLAVVELFGFGRSVVRSWLTRCRLFRVIPVSICICWIICPRLWYRWPLWEWFLYWCSIVATFVRFRMVILIRWLYHCGDWRSCYMICVEIWLLVLHVRRRPLRFHECVVEILFDFGIFHEFLDRGCGCFASWKFHLQFRNNST